MALVDLDRLDRLYEIQHSGRFRSDPQLEAAIDLIDTFPACAGEMRVLRGLFRNAERVCTVLQSRGISFPALENLLDDLEAARRL
jgi:hypothetical protein